MLTLPRLSELLDADPDHLLGPMLWHEFIPRQCRGQCPASKHTRTVPSSTPADDQFSRSVDMGQFEPSELSVKVEGDTVQISGKHEATRDGVYECRQYVQRFPVPENVLAEQMECRVDSRGQLSLKAPLRREEEPDCSQRTIPVQFESDQPTLD